MNSKKLSILSVLAVVLLAAAYFLHSTRQPVTTPGGHGLFLPEFKARLNDVTRVRLAQGEDVTELVLKDDTWVSPDHSDYPIKVERLREFLLHVAGLKEIEAKTSNPDRLVSLELEDPTQEGAKSRSLQAWAGEDQILDLVLGKTRWSPTQGIYVRRAGEDQAWLCEGKVNFDAKSKNWFDRQIVRLGQDKIREVVIERAGEQPLHIHRKTKEDPWELDELPEGKELKPGNPLGQVAGSLSFLSFDDVKAAKGVELPEQPAVRTRFTGYDGLVVEVSQWKIADETWCTLRASKAEPSEGVDETVSDDTIAEDQKEWDPWLFRFPKYDLDTWSRSVADFLPPPPEPTEEEQKAPEAEKTPADSPQDEQDG